MGGQDKALVTLAGKPLLSRLIGQLQPQVTDLAISSNAPAGEYEQFGLPVLPDAFSGFLGPLAGIHAGLRQYPDAYLLCVAVDIPRIPADLAQRLFAGLKDRSVAYPTDGEHHALALLFRPGSAGLLETALQQGEYRVRTFLAAQGAAIRFDRRGDRGLFLNLNTPEALDSAEQSLVNL